MDTPNHAEAAERLREALADKAAKTGGKHLEVKQLRGGRRKRPGTHRHLIEVQAGDVRAVAEHVAGEHVPALRDRSEQRDVEDPGHVAHLPLHPAVEPHAQHLHYGASGLHEGAPVTMQCTCIHRLLELYDQANRAVPTA